ncbi:hypothetical protein SAMN05444484_11722 [Flavobacterium chilense]|uniref:Uncharacterized protein n=1 Tax=Flavobacterium chilense TaxID=946677 RepID=A0A1M7N0V3_9FLAO|nr:hypothetical protein SAMN05444484_11722 [Flavobacterium chilense]
MGIVLIPLFLMLNSVLKINNIKLGVSKGCFDQKGCDVCEGKLIKQVLLHQERFD